MNPKAALCLISLLPAVALAADPAPSTEPAAPTLPTDFKESVLTSMDRTADPCNDFYRYACGGWMDSTKLPADQSRWARSFSTIAEHNRAMIRELLDDAAANPGPAGTERQKIGDYYASCMDAGAVEKAGIEPVQPWLGEIAKVDSVDALWTETGKLHRAGIDPLFAVHTIPDFKTPTLDIAWFFQGGLGLPDRDYYVSTDPKKQDLVVAYRAHVAQMLELAGQTPESAKADAGRIVDFETELAKVSRTRVEMRQFDKLYHRVDLPGLEKLAPNLPWPKFLTAAEHADIQQISVATPEFFQALEKLATSTPMATLRAYLRWNVLNNYAEQLPQAFVDADFDFYGKTLRGQAEIEPRWKRCVSSTSRALGEAIGKLYVEREFPGESKTVAQEMVRDIEGAFASNLPNLAWMDEATRKRAHEKEDKIANKIGYPENWRDYSKMKIARASYLQNAVAATAFEYDRQMNKVGKPVDKSEWGMTPQTVNAYYNPTENDINFPAGILQPPFFRKDYPAAMNYGGIGAVVGHELTHGFDDQGRKFDGDGVLRDWWEPSSAEQFGKAAKCVVDQYSSQEVEPGVHVNGELTLGENIADLGGLKEAYAAYKSWEQRHGAPPPAVPGLTNDQLLFVSWAQVWCTIQTPESLRQQVTVDPHSPGMIRATVPPMDTSAFKEVFSCKAGDKMAPADACTVW